MLLKKFSVVLVGAFLIAQAGVAAEPTPEVLATCVNSTDKADLFKVKGALKPFSGLRVGLVSQSVILEDSAGGKFPGQVTLTKSAPYQYHLYGSFTGKPAKGDLVAPTIAYYGTSAGSKMIVTENNSGKTMTTFECELVSGMLATP
jgi:hypothetical protein